jgi:hypothetical protein
MPFVSLATTVIGGIFSAAGAERQAQANANAANYNAAVARNAATFAQQQGEIRAQASDIRTGQAIGRSRAIAAAGNLDVNSGSPLDIQASNASIGRLNSLTIRNNAAREAWGQNAQAGLYDAQAQNDLEAGDINAAGSLIGAGTSVGDKWSQFRMNGVDPFAAFAFG